MELNRTRLFVAALAVTAVAWAFTAVVSQPAAAQGPGSDFCVEYPNAPGCEEPLPPEPPPTGPTGDGDVPPGPGPDAGGPSADAGAGGELPFTGYPLTALILLLLILLLLGLALRTYMAVRDRIASDRTAGS